MNPTGVGFTPGGWILRPTVHRFGCRGIVGPTRPLAGLPLAVQVSAKCQGIREYPSWERHNRTSGYVHRGDHIVSHYKESTLPSVSVALQARESPRRFWLKRQKSLKRQNRIAEIPDPGGSPHTRPGEEPEDTGIILPRLDRPHSNARGPPVSRTPLDRAPSGPLPIKGRLTGAI